MKRKYRFNRISTKNIYRIIDLSGQVKHLSIFPEVSTFAAIVHKIAAAILLLAFCGQTFNQGFYYLSYLIDKAEYAKNCVNKARPKMNCNGKCQLMKKIEEQEKKQQEQAPEMKLASKSEVFSSKSWYTIATPLYLTEAKHYYLIYNIGSPIDQPSSFFHPPGASKLL